MKRTYVAKKDDIKLSWYIVDAEDKILGRIASKVASILKGKHKPIYTPHLDTGDGVIVVNASKIKVTGRKMKEKTYLHFSGYPGGLKKLSLENMLSKNPCKVMILAVRRMLPTTPLGRKMLKKLKVYADDKHPHKAQNPVVLEV